MKKINKYDVSPTKKQVMAVDNLLSNKFKTKSAAIQAAGLSPKYCSSDFMGKVGVQLYLRKIGKSFKNRYGKSLPYKVMETYADGLQATKLYGKDGIEHPDYSVRKSYADAFSEFFGWKHQSVPAGTKIQQNNFFSVPKIEQEKFNSDFKDFLRRFYG